MQDTKGLSRRGEIWYLDKVIRVGSARAVLRESTGCREIGAAKAVLARRVAETQAQLLAGPKPPEPPREHTLQEAAIEYILDIEERGKDGQRAAWALQPLDPAILALPLSHVHQGALRAWIASQKGVRASGTVKTTLQVVTSVLNFAARVLRDGNTPWLTQQPPKLSAPDWGSRQPVRLSWEQQSLLVAALPAHLVPLVELALYTGGRQEEIVSLAWARHYPHPDAPEFAFWWIPPEIRKHSARKTPSQQVGRYLVCNALARDVIKRQRESVPPEASWVFPSTRTLSASYQQSGRLYRINNHGWRAACQAAGLVMRVHDLRHTFGERAADASIPLDMRRSLLGHEHRDITLHYSAPGLLRLLEEAEKIVRPVPRLTLVAPASAARVA